MADTFSELVDRIRSQALMQRLGPATPASNSTIGSGFGFKPSAASLPSGGMSAETGNAMRSRMDAGNIASLRDRLSTLQSQPDDTRAMVGHNLPNDEQGLTPHTADAPLQRRSPIRFAIGGGPMRDYDPEVGTASLTGRSVGEGRGGNLSVVRSDYLDRQMAEDAEYEEIDRLQRQAALAQLRRQIAGAPAKLDPKIETALTIAQAIGGDPLDAERQAMAGYLGERQQVPGAQWFDPSPTELDPIRERARAEWIQRRNLLLPLFGLRVPEADTLG